MIISVLIPHYRYDPARAVASIRRQIGVQVEIVTWEDVEGSGPGFARNECLARASGDVIAMQDADDWSRPDRLVKQLAVLKQGWDVVTCNMTWNSGLFRSCPMVPAQYMKDFTSPVMATVMAWRHVFDAVGPYIHGFDTPEDADWAIRSLKAGFRWGYVDEHLYHYDNRPNTASRRLANGWIARLKHKHNLPSI